MVLPLSCVSYTEHKLKNKSRRGSGTSLVFVLRYNYTKFCSSHGGEILWVVTQPFPSYGGEILCGGHKISSL